MAGLFHDLSAWIARARTGSADTITVAGESSWHRPQFRMQSCGGRDQVARIAGGGWAAFERPTPTFFSRAVAHSPGGLVVDVGANTGFYTLLALSLVPGVQVAAYEPMQPIRRILHANLKLNKMRHRARIFAAAASDADGEATLHIPDDRHGLIETSASLSPHFKQNKSGAVLVPTVRLDTAHRGTPRVAVLKVDAESHDLAVLRGAQAMMRRDRPFVFVEVLLGADEAGLTDILTRCGYDDIVLFPDGPSAARRHVVHETLAWNHLWVPEEVSASFLA